MNSDRIKLLKEEAAKEDIRRKEEIKRNPLSQYSTSQLKAELRRRKRCGRGVEPPDAKQCEVDAK